MKTATILLPVKLILLTIESLVPSHGFRDGYAVLFQSPYTGDTDGGLADGAVYYVNVIDTNTIQLHTDIDWFTIFSIS